MKLTLLLLSILALLFFTHHAEYVNESKQQAITLCSSGEVPSFTIKTRTHNPDMKSNDRTLIYRLEASVFNWEIAPGKSIEAWGYNNQVPGPTLRATKGDTLLIIVKNSLPEPTTIHWHGLRIPSVMDGTEEVQRLIMPGEEFEYRFVVPDAGTFWYHPHTNETVQMERGLYGAIVVTDDLDPQMDEDRVLVIDDMKLNSRNQFKVPSWFLPRWLERHDGREGETLLINGIEKPELNMASGQYARWRLINASSARYFLFHLSGRSFNLIGTDGGLIERQVRMTEVLMSPGERMDIVVGPFKEGEKLYIQSLPYNRGTGEGELLHLATVSVGAAENSSADLPGIMRSIGPIATQGVPVNRTIKLHGKRSWKNGVDFTINDQMHLHDKPVKVGHLQVWEITNPSMLDHPFHLHGFFFQVLQVNGVAPSFIAWKDTFSVPREGRIKIAWLPDNRPGKWMYHCHILEHAAAGMMAHFEIVNDSMQTRPPSPLTETLHAH
jgi:FtsP/CotA-like multicopper oxidase with cupredoxin domain